MNVFWFSKLSSIVHINDSLDLSLMEDMKNILFTNSSNTIIELSSNLRIFISDLSDITCEHWLNDEILRFSSTLINKQVRTCFVYNVTQIHNLDIIFNDAKDTHNPTVVFLCHVVNHKHRMEMNE